MTFLAQVVRLNNNMPTLDLTIEPKIKQGKISVEMDLNRFERVVNALNLFNPAFLLSVENAENDYRKGSFKKIKSLKSLKKI